MIICNIIFAVCIYYEIVFLIKSKRKNDILYFKRFYGLFIGLFLSLILYMIHVSSDLYTFDRSGWDCMEELIYAVIIMIINIILAIVSLLLRFVFKNKKKYKNTSKMIDFFKYFLIVVLLNTGLIFINHTNRLYKKYRIDKEVANEALIYLENKYGKEEFEILEIEREFADNGWIETDLLDYYEVEVLHVKSKKEFDVELSVDAKRNIIHEESCDSLLYGLYGKEIDEEELKTKGIIKKEAFEDYLNRIKLLNVNIEMSDYYENGHRDNSLIPNSYNKIPSEREFIDLVVDYKLKHEMTLTIDTNELKNSDRKKEIKNYLLILENYIIEYYDELEEYEIYCKYQNGKENYNGKLIINNENIILDFNHFHEIVKIEK